jgi:hypothetical protein
MPNFFHVNHSCPDYVPGYAIQLVAMDWSQNAMLGEWFPDGLTIFGIRHVVPDTRLGRVSDEKMELEFECERIRRHFYRHKPSRLQSVFALASLDEAVHFRAHLGALERHSEIWIVEAAVAGHRGDMQLLDPAAREEQRLRDYWGGRRGDHLPPIWELLLSPPVTLIRRVE